MQVAPCFLGRRGGHACGVVDQDVYCTETLSRLREHRIHSGTVGHIAAQRQALAALSLETRLCVIQRRRINVAQYEMRAFVGHRRGDHAAQAGSSAGDQCHFASQAVESGFPLACHVVAPYSGL
ncbi:hypothetical protein D3C71_1703640 [compost metagenome]